LKDAGIIARPLDMVVRTDKPTAVEIAELIAEQARAVGITIAIRRVAVSELVAPNGPLYGGNYDLALFPFIAGFDPDVYDQFACSRVPPHGFDKPRFCDHALDRLMLAAVRPYAREQRLPYYHSIERILARELPLVVLYQAISVDAFPAWLHREQSAPDTPFWNVADWRP
jgi:ABC-type transport system substrate-binding protein